MNYTIYNPDTGDIVSTISTNDELARDIMLQNCCYVLGHYDGNTHYVHQGTVTPKPLRPGPDYIWKNAGWVIDAVLIGIQSRQHRDQLLSQIDRVNPIWYGSLTSQQQSELAQYRQCLLDVPQQPGWPEDITWPRVPTWL
jgi:hypothetical protein